MTAQEQLYELSFYTLAHKEKRFIHQHIVDAFAAQMADNTTKSITIFFALVGLYLFVEKNYTGKQVQDAHIQLSKKPKEYPKIELPESRGNIRLQQVLETPPGIERDNKIHQWCISVWEAFSNEHEKIISSYRNLLAR